MKTQITIQATIKENLIDAIRRAMKDSAVYNNANVKLVYVGVEAIVNANDNLTKVLHTIKIKSVMQEIAKMEKELEG